LISKGFDTAYSIAERRLIFIDAEILFTELMKDGRDKFVYNFSMVGQEVIADILKKFPKFRAFGELVDVLCANGMMDIAVDVEKVWQQFVQKYNFILFCAYSSANLRNTPDASQVADICKNHSHLLSE
jgi:hypothetical protein